jgi:hypothetical protein
LCACVGPDSATVVSARGGALLQLSLSGGKILKSRTTHSLSSPLSLFLPFPFSLLLFRSLRSSTLLNEHFVRIMPSSVPLRLIRTFTRHHFHTTSLRARRSIQLSWAVTKQSPRPLRRNNQFTRLPSLNVLLSRFRAHHIYLPPGPTHGNIPRPWTPTAILPARTLCFPFRESCTSILLLHPLPKVCHISLLRVSPVSSFCVFIVA